MTITLAAVYAPIGLQGGLTGTLFREFALTLAGAVTISGIVALTLSPMMSAYLLRGAAAEERGFTGMINRHFDVLRRAYGRALDSALASRGYIYVAWVVVGLLTIPMYMFSPKELAPTEDQGVIFGILQAGANATADQNAPFAKAADDAFRQTPEADLTFQIMFPPSNPFAAAQGVSGFSGAVMKPWHAPRQRTVFQILPEIQNRLSRIPGLQIFATTPSALPGGSNFPVEFVIASTSSSEQLLEFAQKISMKAAQSGMFYYPPQIDLKYDQPQSEVDHRPREGRHARPQPVAGGRRPRLGVGRQLRQPVQHLRAQLQGHPADRAHRPADPRPA
jgi:multidrug efflux pump